MALQRALARCRALSLPACNSRGRSVAGYFALDAPQDYNYMHEQKGWLGHNENQDCTVGGLDRRRSIRGRLGAKHDRHGRPQVRRLYQGGDEPGRH